MAGAAVDARVELASTDLFGGAVTEREDVVGETGPAESGGAVEGVAVGSSALARPEDESCLAAHAQSIG